MRKVLLASALAALVGGVSTGAEAHLRPVPLDAPGLVDAVACRVVRERVERPNGSVVFRTRRDCGPGGPGYGFGPRRGGPGCRVVRERVERPNGSVVFRTRRTCG